MYMYVHSPAIYVISSWDGSALYYLYIKIKSCSLMVWDEQLELSRWEYRWPWLRPLALDLSSLLPLDWPHLSSYNRFSYSRSILFVLCSHIPCCGDPIARTTCNRGFSISYFLLSSLISAFWWYSRTSGTSPRAAVTASTGSSVLREKRSRYQREAVIR